MLRPLAPQDGVQAQEIERQNQKNQQPREHYRSPHPQMVFQIKGGLASAEIAQSRLVRNGEPTRDMPDKQFLEFVFGRGEPEGVPKIDSIACRISPADIVVVMLNMT